MSSLIKINKEMLEEIKSEFDKFISDISDDFENKIGKLRAADGKIKVTKEFTKSLGGDKQKATLYFLPAARLKMARLIDMFDKEVAWHGEVKRAEDCDIKIADEFEHGYIVSDIVIYPQSTNGAYVDMDIKKYQQWLDDNYDNPVFTNLRLQGHSHVNMGVTPSAQDLSSNEKLLQQVPDDSFYIFNIANKKGDISTRIYDLSKNIYFENSDVKIKFLLPDGTILDDFEAEAKKMVQSISYSSETKASKHKKSTSSKSKKTKTSYEEMYRQYSNYYYDYDDADEELVGTGYHGGYGAYGDEDYMNYYR